jgi:hypothetical protein
MATTSGQQTWPPQAILVSAIIKKIFSSTIVPIENKRCRYGVWNHGYISEYYWIYISNFES